MFLEGKKEKVLQGKLSGLLTFTCGDRQDYMMRSPSLKKEVMVSTSRAHPTCLSGIMGRVSWGSSKEEGTHCLKLPCFQISDGSFHISTTCCSIPMVTASCFLDGQAQYSMNPQPPSLAPTGGIKAQGPGQVKGRWLQRIAKCGRQDVISLKTLSPWLSDNRWE